jgi:archaeal preflagellin peptidase FlaK
MDWMPIARLAVAIAVLFYASYTDWKTRTASDTCWLVMGAAGLVFLAIEIINSGNDLVYLLMLIPIGWIFFDLLIDRDGLFESGINYLPLGLYVISFVILGWMLFSFNGDAFFWALISIPLMFLLYFVLYILDVVKGGADAKALIALSLLIPTYPVIGSIPLVDLPSDVAQYVMPFSLLTLFYGALLTLVVPLYYLVTNIVRGDRRFPSMLFGVRMDISDAKKKFVWPMEYIEGEEVRISSLPKGPESLEEHFASLEAKGLTTIWVTPKIPMLIPMTAGLIIAALLGNVMFLFF